MLTPRQRMVAVLASGVFTLPALALLGNQTQGNWQRQQARAAMSQANQDAAAIALERAKSCVLLDVDTPLSDGGIATYRGQPARFLPPNQLICDNSGNTAVVGQQGMVFDVRSAPMEQVNALLQARGFKVQGPIGQKTNLRK